MKRHGPTRTKAFSNHISLILICFIGFSGFVSLAVLVADDLIFLITDTQSSDVERQRAKLNHWLREVRYKAVENLENIGPPAAASVPDLLKVCLDLKEEPLISRNACHALAHIGIYDLDSMHKLIDFLSSKENASASANHALKGLRNPPEEIVVRLFSSSNVMANHHGSKLLSTLSADSQFLVIAEFAGADEFGKVRIIYLLSDWWGTPEIAQLYRDTLLNGVARARIATAQQLGEIGEPAKEFAPILKELIPATSGREKAFFIQALAKLAPEENPRFFERMLADHELVVRLASMQALGQLEVNKTNVESLVDIVLPDFDASYFLQSELTSMRKYLLPSLIRLLGSENDEVIERALFFLTLLYRDAEDALPYIEKLKDHGTPSVRLAAARALRSIEY